MFDLAMMPLGEIGFLSLSCVKEGSLWGYTPNYAATQFL